MTRVSDTRSDRAALRAVRDADAERLRLAHAEAHKAELIAAERIAAEVNPDAVAPDWTDPRTADPSTIDLWPAPGEPWEVAQGLLLRDWTDRDSGLLTLRRWRGAWREWTGTHWAEVEEAAMRARLYASLAEAMCASDGKTVSWAPSRSKIDGVLDALAAATHLDATVEPGGWIDGGPRLIPTASGLLDPRARIEIDSTPAFFNLHALPVGFDPDADCPSWRAFLDSVWPDDPESVALLQQWFGYLISGRTDLQKALLMKGVRRGGKGTVLHIATLLVGEQASAGMTLTAMRERFGLMPLLGASLATFGDVRLEGPTSTLVERLLSLIGGDRLTVDRKSRDPIPFTCSARFMLASNLPIRLHDPSGAIATRFVILPFSRSFLGREDLGLVSRLEAELSGILAWALDGLTDLERTGRLVEPGSAAQFRSELETLSSPITQFIDDACVIDTGATVPKAHLYLRYRTWCETAGHRPAGDAQFAAELMSLGLGVSSSRLRVEGGREYVFKGIRIADAL